MKEESTRQKKLKQYRAMLELARRKDTPKEEANTALLRAQEFFAAYEFTPEELEELNQSGGFRIIDAIVDELPGSDVMPTVMMSLGVAHSFRCSHYAERDVRGTLAPTPCMVVHFVGAHADVQMALEFYKTAKVAMDNMADAFMRSRVDDGYSPWDRVPRAERARRDYMAGCFQGICDGLKEQFMGQLQQGLMVMPPPTAIAHVEKVMGRPGSLLVEVDLNPTDETATVAGYKDGKQFTSGKKAVDGSHDQQKTIEQRDQRLIGGKS